MRQDAGTVQGEPPQPERKTIRWVVQSGLECADRPCYELYHDDCRGKTCRFDICIPLVR